MKKVINGKVYNTETATCIGDYMKDNIKIEGHIGTWYVIDEATRNDTLYYLLEHEEYGSDTACLVVDSDYKIILDDVWNGFDDLDYFLEECQ
jgi:hypothetical protein